MNIFKKLLIKYALAQYKLAFRAEIESAYEKGVETQKALQIEYENNLAKQDKDVKRLVEIYVNRNRNG